MQRSEELADEIASKIGLASVRYGRGESTLDTLDEALNLAAQLMLALFAARAAARVDTASVEGEA